MISRFARNFATLQIVAFVILLIWRPGHSFIPALAFLAGISATIVVDKIAGGSIPQLEVIRVPPEAEDIERGVMGMVGTEETFMRTINGLMYGAWANQPEVILYAAIKHPDGRVFAVSRPGRHGHVHQLMEMLNSLDVESASLDRQGFLTSLGSWVSREQGLEIAQRNKQIIHKHPQEYELYSEDMWEAV